MKRKVDFTVKGTRLPKIQIGTLYDLEDDAGGYAKLRNDMPPLVSFGLKSATEIYAEKSHYTGVKKFIFKISTIEALAEEQGMLWEEDETPSPPVTIPPSIKQLLEKATNLEYSFRTGFDLFTGLDELYKKTMCERALQDLRSTVAELNTILNPLPMQSVVEIAEEVLTR